MKKIIITLISVLFIIALSTTAVLASEAARLSDGADLLTDAEEAQLLAKLDEISEKYKLDAVVVTVESVGDKTEQEYADDYFDANDFGFGDDGILMLYCAETDKGHITTTGKCIEVFNDSAIGSIGTGIRRHLDIGNYYDAFTSFAADCENYMEIAVNGAPFNFGFTVVVSVVIGLIGAFIVGGKLKGQLKTVKAKEEAESYIKKDSLNVTNSNDFFLYRNVTRKEKKQESSDDDTTTHTSSSGTTHGGGGF